MAEVKPADDKAAKTKPAQQGEQQDAPQTTANANHKFVETKLTEVRVHLRKNNDGTETLSHYTAEVGKKIKDVMMEPRRALQLNRSWHTRKVIYLPAEEKTPEYLKRIMGAPGKKVKDKAGKRYDMYGFYDEHCTVAVHTAAEDDDDDIEAEEEE